MRVSPLSVVLLVLGCSGPSGPSGSPTAAAPLPSDPSRIRMVIQNFAADEGEMWTFEVRADGGFSADGMMSNGDATRTLWSCQGRAPSGTAARWLERLGRVATLRQPAPLPAVGEALARGQSLGFVIARIGPDGATMYADPGPMQADLEAWSRELDQAKRCTTFDG